MKITSRDRFIKTDNFKGKKMKYRACYTYLLESTTPLIFYSHAVDSQESAEDSLNTIADYTLHLYEKKLMDDYSNCGWLECMVDGEWVDIEE